jgi:hypothetical protein
MGVENDLCLCGHDRGQHQHLLGTEIRYPWLKCACPTFRERYFSRITKLAGELELTLKVSQQTIEPLYSLSDTNLWRYR